MVVLGGKEEEAGMVALRTYHGGDMGQVPLGEAVARVAGADKARALTLE